MKIYTKSGDDGTSGLLGEERRPKADPIFDALGSIDELNACLGLACNEAYAELSVRLQEIQSRLFDLGAELAQVNKTGREIRSVETEDVTELEADIDRSDSEVAPLRNFVLPGGTELAARLHLARTVCRRAEREVLRLAQGTEIRREPLIYLNRLSDWLFAMARLANARANVPDQIWHPRS